MWIPGGHHPKCVPLRDSLLDVFKIRDGKLASFRASPAMT